MADDADPAKLARDWQPTYREMMGESREDTMRRLDRLIEQFDLAGGIDHATPAWWRNANGR